MVTDHLRTPHSTPATEPLTVRCEDEGRCERRPSAGPTCQDSLPALFAAYSAERECVKWPLPEALILSPEVAYRNRFAEALSFKTPEEIVGSYVYLSATSMRRLVDLALRNLQVRPLAGYGIELGAGCGLLSSVVASSPQVRGVFALEVCEKMAAFVIPKIAASILGEESSKVVPVVGSFDDVRLADNSLDFAIEIDSLHHSANLERTLKECTRLLKPGGTLLCFDRCHANSVTDDQVEEMLNRVYPKDFLIANHYPADVVLTRRQNGEHEYRMFEWERAFNAVGLRLVKTAHFGKAVSARTALKGLLSYLPRPLRHRLRIGKNETPAMTTLWLRQGMGRLTNLLWNSGEILGPKETTAFYLQKP